LFTASQLLKLPSLTKPAIMKQFCTACDIDVTYAILLFLVVEFVSSDILISTAFLIYSN